MTRPLELSPDGTGWLLDGRPWTPRRPFLAVLGRPVAASLSPRLQTAALRATAIEFDYLALDIGSEELPALHTAACAADLPGFNVTMPCKEAAAALCAGLSDAARAVGAVNTVRVEPHGWFGHNTDIGGIAAVVRARTASRPATAVVLGAGGSARAAVLALQDVGARRIRVVARRGERYDAMGDWLHGLDVDAASVPWGSPLGGLLTTSDDVVVSCVPPGVDGAELLHGPTPARPALWLDLRYGSSRPDALSTLDPPWCDGRDVLLEQGILSFEWWFDRPAPRAVMRRALDAP